MTQTLPQLITFVVSPTFPELNLTVQEIFQAGNV
jgi:Uma2 family endonuclease